MRKPLSSVLLLAIGACSPLQGAALTEYVEHRTLALSRGYEQDERDLLLGQFVEHYAALKQFRRAEEIVTAYRAGLTPYQPLIRERMAAQDLNGALALIENAIADSAAKVRARHDLVALAAANGDNLSIVRILEAFARGTRFDTEQLNEVYRISRFGWDDSSARRMLINTMRSLLPAFPQQVRSAVIQTLVMPAASIDDISIASILDTLGVDTHAHAQMLALLAASLRVKNDSRADSVYARALAVATISGKSALANYWRHYMPALSDNNPTRFLTQMGDDSRRRTFLRGVLAIHLANGRTELPLRIVNDLALRGDTAGALRLAIDALTPPIDNSDPTWQPRPSQSAARAVLRRALEYTARLNNPDLRRVVRHFSLNAFLGIDTALVAVLQREMLALEPERPDIAVEGLIDNQPDSALVLINTVTDSARRESIRVRVASTLSRRGRYEDAFEVASTLRSAAQRVRANISIASRDSTSADTTRVLAIVSEGIATLEPKHDFDFIVYYALPLVIKYKTVDGAVKWAESQPAGQRGFAMMALLRHLWTFGLNTKTITEDRHNYNASQ